MEHSFGNPRVAVSLRSTSARADESGSAHFILIVLPVSYAIVFMEPPFLYHEGRSSPIPWMTTYFSLCFPTRCVHSSHNSIAKSNQRGVYGTYKSSGYLCCRLAGSLTVKMITSSPVNTWTRVTRLPELVNIFTDDMLSARNHIQGVFYGLFSFVPC